MPRLRVPPSLLIGAIALASFGLLLVRSRPLERFNAGSEALLYATGLDAPRALYSLDDGTILAAEREGSATRVVEIGVDGSLTRVASPSPALLLADTGSSDSTLPFPRLGTAWSVWRAPDDVALAALPLSNRVVRVAPDGAQRIVAEGFAGAGGRNPLPVAVALSPSGEVHVALFSTDPGRTASGQVLRVDAAGRHQVAFDRLTLPIGLGFGANGQLYVLELARGVDARSGNAVPNTGRLLALGPAPHQRRTVVRDLDLPSGLVFTPAGDAYFTERAFPPALSTSPAGAYLLRLPAPELAPGVAG